MRRHVLTLTFAAASLAAALPTAAAHAAGAGAPAPRASDGGVYATADTSDAQQRAFWDQHDSNGTFRPFKGEMRDWKPDATPPKADAPGAGKPVKAPATAPVRKAKSGITAGSPGETRLRATTGRVRIAWPNEEKPGWWNISLCTGNVISSDSKDMVATARHCIPHDGQGRINPQAEYEFTPGYYTDDKGEHAPVGKWTYRGLGVVGSFTVNAPQTDDTAFLALNTQNGTHVQDAVGASGYQFNIGSLPSQVVFAGIPADSNQFHTCVKQPYWGSDNPPQIMGRGGPCTGGSDLPGGASGGPLLNGDTFDSGPVQIGNYSGSAGDDPAAAAWRDPAYAVFNSMQGVNGQPAHNKITTLTNANNNLADLYQYNTGDGTAVYSYHATGTENQQWHLWDQGGGYFLIENRYTERNGLTGANARVLDYNFSNGTAWSHQVNGGGSDNQLWRFRATPNRPGWYSVRSKRGDLCLGAPSGEGQLTVSSCTTADGLDSMQWKLQ
ncbi:hypothetical protein ACFWXK_37285 [Streptomyces sp. NPDC059070]|uniref:RICIN domain-containing protein n=1 Tax=Streptomyces sp. NPDC059070 TaxID=3346713 RepID=UPI0036BCCC27